MEDFNLSRDNLIHWIGEIKLTKDHNAGMLSDGSGNLTLGVEVKYPGVYTQSESEYYKYFNDLYRAIQRTIPGTVVHVLDFYTVEQYESNYENKYYATKYHYRQFDGTSYLRHSSFWFFTFLVNDKEDLLVNYKKSAGSRAKRKAVDIPASVYNSYYRNSKSDFLNRVKEINGIEGVKVKILNGVSIRSVLLNYFNQSYDQWEGFKGQHLQPMMVERGRLMIGANYVGVNSMSMFPDELSNWTHGRGIDPSSVGNGTDFRSDVELPVSFSYPVGLGLPINHVVSTSFVIAEKDKVMHRLTKELSKDRNIQFWNNDIYAIKRDIIKGGSERESFSEFLAEGGKIPVIFNQNVFVKGKTIEELHDHQEFVSQAYNKMQASAVTENAFTWHFLASNAPGCIAYNSIGSKVTVLEQAICLLPRETHLKTDTRGFLYVDRMGNPIVVDMRKKPLGISIFNQNMLIFGDSGSGKSFFMNDFIDQSHNMGYHYIILDVGGSYKEPSGERKGVRYIDTEDRDSMRFNPFLLCKRARGKGKWIYKDEDETETDDQGSAFIIETVYAVLDSIIGAEERIDTDTKTALKMAIANYYEFLNEHLIIGDEKKPGFTGFTKYLEVFAVEFEARFKGLVEFERIILRLYPYSEGEYSYLLNSPEVIDISMDRGIIFDVKAIEGNLSIKKIVNVCICQLAVDKLEKLPFNIPKIFGIDEAVDFLIGDMGGFIGGLFRKIRKNGGGVTLATQDAKFLNAADELTKDSIISNSDIRILLGVKKESIQDAMTLLSLNEENLKVIRSLKNHPDNKYREVYMKIREKSVVLRVQMPRQAYWRFTTDPNERPVRDEKVEQYQGNVDLAVEELVEKENVA